MLLGFSFLIRWPDFIPLGLWILYDLFKRHKLFNFVVISFGFVLIASVQLFYNFFISGDMTNSPLQIYAALGLHDKMYISIEGIWITIQRIGELFLVFPPLLMLFFMYKRQYLELKSKPYILLIIGIFVIYYFYIASLGYSYGPRYVLAYFPFVVLLVINLKNWVQDILRNKIYRLTIILLILVSIAFTSYSYYEISERKDLIRCIENLPAGKKIILLNSGTYKMSQQDLTRNYPDFNSNNTLIFSFNNSLSISNFLKMFPGYLVYVYEYPSRISKFKGF
jgi:hypothetical protein